MKTNIHTRLVQFIAYKKMSNTDFGVGFRASRQEVSNWCKGTKMNVYRIGDMLEAYPELNGHWFLSGEGKMLKNSKEQEPDPIYFSPDVKKIIDEKDKEILRLNSKVIKLQEEKIKLLEKERS